VADVSVRPAAVDDAGEIARIQTETWRIAYRSVLPEAVLQSLDQQSFHAGWQQAVSQPPSLAHHVLVALEGSTLVGFAAFGPDADRQPQDPPLETSAAIGVLLVEPRWGRRGHGSRLLAAVADLARTAGLTRLVAWVPAADTASLPLSGLGRRRHAAQPGHRPRYGGRVATAHRPDPVIGTARTERFGNGAGRRRQHGIHRNSLCRAGLLRGSGSRQLQGVLDGAQAGL
jgi:GNAT superfamily N-acetyltransferase